LLGEDAVKHHQDRWRMSEPSVPERCRRRTVASERVVICPQPSRHGDFRLAAVVAIGRPEAAANSPRHPTLADANPPRRTRRQQITRSRSNAPARQAGIGRDKAINRNIGTLSATKSRSG